jgi:arylsulfatase A-like enzyme
MREVRRVSDRDRPNILVIWGDDIGITNLSCYSDGLMGYRTPNIDRIAAEGMRFTDSYGEQSCTAGRSSFITGQSVFRTGLSKVGIPAAPLDLQAEDPTIAELLKPLGHATGQVGKNHLGDRNEYLPTVHAGTTALAGRWLTEGTRRRGLGRERPFRRYSRPNRQLGPERPPPGYPRWRAGTCGWRLGLCWAANTTSWTVAQGIREAA